MRSTLLLTAAWAAFGAAQSGSGTSTVSLLLPWADSGDLVASVVTAAPNATVYAIGCSTPSGACGATCVLTTSVTITEGTSTLGYTWTDGDGALPTPAPGYGAGSNNVTSSDVITVSCDLVGGAMATQAVCTGVSAANNGSSTQTTTLSGSAVTYVPITITAGASKIASNGTYTTSSTATAISGKPASASATNAAGPMLSVGGYAMAGVAGIAAVALL